MKLSWTACYKTLHGYEGVSRKVRTKKEEDMSSTFINVLKAGSTTARR
jgi:hypothetical protein